MIPEEVVSNIIEVFPESKTVRERYWERQSREKDTLIASQAAEILQWKESNTRLSECVGQQAALIQSMREALEWIATYSVDDASESKARAALAQVSASPTESA